MSEPARRLRRGIEQLPAAAEEVTRFVVDNPVQVGLVMSGSIVISKMLLRAVHPRGPVEALATMVAAAALCGGLAAQAVKRGWIPPLSTMRCETCGKVHD